MYVLYVTNQIYNALEKFKAFNAFTAQRYTGTDK